ncbi:Wall-associated receptor kinase 2 [Linum grandiflorum]
MKIKYSQAPLAAVNLLLLILQLTPSVSSSDVVKYGHCPGMCGNVTVPYPFGYGDDPKCAISEFFLLKCNNSGGEHEHQLLVGNVRVLKISYDESTFSSVMDGSYNCYNETGAMEGDYLYEPWMSLGGGPFRFANKYNRLFAFGCDTIAAIIMTGFNESTAVGSGCVSLCVDNPSSIWPSNLANPSGAIVGSCQSSIPSGSKAVNLTVTSTANHSDIFKWNPCDYAFLADYRVFETGRVNMSEFPYYNPPSSTAAIEWVVEEKKCDDAKLNTTAYACLDNSDCVDAEDWEGYRCKCKHGFRGNPYLGCQNINECLEPENYPCHGKCKDTYGDYTCTCLFGMRGDGKVGCKDFRLLIVAVIGGLVLLFTIILLVVILYKRRKREKNFLHNGGILLQHQRVRIFKESELSTATNNYSASNFLGEGGFGHVYKGTLSDSLATVVAIKKPKGSLDKAHTISQEFQHEIEVVSQVNHINVVKVVGLCLETKLPLLVYEFIPNGTLFDHIHKQRSRVMSTWKHRLRIATEVAHALDYLHSLANPPIIHGDIKSTNILIDSEFRAKVSDFGASVLISSDQPATMLNKIQGTLGYLDPEYLLTGDLNPKSDVYSFGAVMVELLTGEKPYSKSSGEKVNLIQYFMSSDFDEIIRFWGVHVEDGETEEMEAFAEVARQCLNFSGMKRPAMKEVAEELSRLRKLNNSHSSCRGYDGTEETECLLRKNIGSASSMSFGYSQQTLDEETEELPPPPSTAETNSVVTFDIESFEIFR